MKRFFYFIILSSVFIFWNSCRNDFDFSPSTGGLEFSRDTIYLDTIFSNIGSSTYNLKVYNRSDEDISIPSVRLGLGEASNYRLNVDGMAGKEFANVELLANDSLYIFVETTVDIQTEAQNSLQFLYTDAIEFDSGTNSQKVELVTLVKDAIFIFPNRDMGMVETLTFDADGDGTPDETNLQGRFLAADELNFTNEKPYVIYGFAAVNEGDELTIDAGARVHFHANSGLLITNNASLKVNGELSTDPELLENEVIFESDRLEPEFSDVPGQWSTIYLFNGSINNEINYATIKNSTVGILCEGNQDATIPKLTLKNTQIYNSSNFGILATASSITAENVILNNSGQSSFAGTFGGKYNFTHCTIANYWDNSFRQFPALLLNNFITDENNVDIGNNLTEANFNNCIIYGNDNPELILDELDGFDFNFKFSNCLIRFEDNNDNFVGENYDFGNEDLFSDCIFNADPGFEAPFENHMKIGEDSAANFENGQTGRLIFAAQVPFDILSVNRETTPDLGAYQHVTFEDN